MSAQGGGGVILIGAGGHGSELASYVQDLIARGEKIRVVGFVDENKPPGRFHGSKILGDFRDLGAFLRAHTKETFHYITATGDNKRRREFVQKIECLRAKNLRPWTLRHPWAHLSQEVQIEEGTCLAPGVIVTSRVQIGRHCILNVNASVSHDCIVGDFVNINPGATICGNVRIGKGCYIGAGATVIEKVSIGNWTVIGAGAVVVDDIPSHVTAVGVPARVIKRHSV